MSFDVDADARVIESSTAMFRSEQVLDGTAFLGVAPLAVVSALRRGDLHPRAAWRDDATGAHWLVEGRLRSNEPWCARLAATDVTVVVLADRRDLLEKSAHALRNLGFGIDTVLRAFAEDRPTGQRFEDYLEHARDPVARLLAVGDAMASCAIAVRPTLERLSVAHLVDGIAHELAVERTRERGANERAERFVLVDRQLLSEAVRRIVGSGSAMGAATLSHGGESVDDRPYAVVQVEFAVRSALRVVPTGRELWDLASNQDLESVLRRHRARNIVVAHGGDVITRWGPRGRLTFVLRLPAVSEG